MEKLKIRTVRPEDAEELVKIYEYYVEHTAITFEYEVPSAEQFRERIIHTLKRYPYLVAETEDRIAGYAYAGAFNERASYDWSAELSVYVDREMRKKGVGKALYEELSAILKQMGIINLYACIGSCEKEDEYLDHNSEQFHAHMGFAKIGTFRNCGYKFGRWYNIIWMEKGIGNHNDTQMPVVWFPQLKMM